MLKSKAILHLYLLTAKNEVIINNLRSFWIDNLRTLDTALAYFTSYIGDTISAFTRFSFCPINSIAIYE
jgi:hypothetical protein